jgi:hypothetical protein
MYPEDAHDMESLFTNADLLMYEGKRAKSDYVVYGNARGPDQAKKDLRNELRGSA